MFNSEIVSKDRAALLAKARAFFQERSVLEVDCCALSRFAAIDSNIDVIPVQITPTQVGYLHTSPEYAMKRLLASGSGDIYYLGHVYRQSEIGRLHNPEFTMAEWYRLGITFEQMMQETCDFLSLFLGPLPTRTISYREAFATHLNLDYSSAPLSILLSIASRYSPSSDVHTWPRDALIHFLLTHAIEPSFNPNELTLLIDYPPHEAALARLIEKNHEIVAERFEIYHQGVELANGYHELPDALEQRRRFEQENRLRHQANKPTYALDEAFLKSLSTFPDCCGVSVGFDRAFMLRHRRRSLHDILPFSWGITSL